MPKEPSFALQEKKYKWNSTSYFNDSNLIEQGACSCLGHSQNQNNVLVLMASLHSNAETIKRDLDPEQDELKTRQQSNKPVQKGGSLEAVFAASGSLLVGGLAIVFSSQRSTNQRAALTGGVLGGAAGLLVGYGVGRLFR